MFRRVLVANRGEIAARICRACHSLDVEAVVVHSEADRGAPWLAEADASVCVGPARSAESYLDQSAILQAAEQTGCQAIHPGYGFLAENARFAARCEQQGLSFVGPRPSAIRRMGDKAEARRTMDAAGLPTIPGSVGILASAGEAATHAERLGYPVLLKATAGGGGKGMRRADDASGLRRAFDEARVEAEQAFGDPGLYLERLIERGRHVEFQVLCDAYGAAIHLGERECSIQRQHQKLVEESPSPAIDAATRERVGRKVARAVARLGYRGAGTVEFLRAPDGALYFMEMNTRLQVEHPVTELVTGVDLVVEQLRIAANQPLRLKQKAIRFSGHAIEFRINAEDPADGFRPAPGLIEAFSAPPPLLDGATVRWDGAARAGWRIPPHYDSLVGKLIVHAADRKSALAGARSALDALRLSGIPHTGPLHRRLLDDPGFCSGDYHVGHLADSGLVGPG